MLPATRFRGMTRPMAIAVLAGVVLAAALLIGPAFAPEATAVENAPGHGDLALYGQIIERMRGGQDYYSAAHAELLAGGYGTTSVLNWRTPLLPYLLSLLPSIAWGQVLLGVVAVAAAGLTLRLTWRTGGRGVAIALAPLLLLSLSTCLLPGLVSFSEVPAGVLILLSAAAYGLGMRRTGLAAGALALFVRELAGLYVLVSITAAWRQRRWGEVGAWGAVLVVYALYFGWHYFEVQAQLGPLDGGYPQSYLQFGGLGFLLNAASFNGLLFILPLWVSAIVLVLGTLGVLAWPAGWRFAATVAGYLGLLAIFGKPFNLYWGGMFTPLLTLGVPWGVLALVDLARAAR